jgi:hypothetical protein
VGESVPPVADVEEGPLDVEEGEGEGQDRLELSCQLECSSVSG